MCFGYSLNSKTEVTESAQKHTGLLRTTKRTPESESENSQHLRPDKREKGQKSTGDYTENNTVRHYTENDRFHSIISLHFSRGFLVFEEGLGSRN